MRIMDDFIYCPYCASRLERKVIFNRTRSCCSKCGFVHFRDPKVAVIAFVTFADKLLLVCRAVEPAKGKWALPGGYMDAGEMPEDALRRELEEEVGLSIRINRLLDIFAMDEAPSNGDEAKPAVRPARGIVLVYQGEPESDGLITLQSMDDVSAAGWFGADELPDEIAFASTERLVAEWVAKRGAPNG